MGNAEERGKYTFVRLIFSLHNSALASPAHFWRLAVWFCSTLTQISEKQKSLYEALERQQHYQEALQSISTKMESIEASLNEGLEPGKSPESQMAAHQVRKAEGENHISTMFLSFTGKKKKTGIKASHMYHHHHLSIKT